MSNPCAKQRVIAVIVGSNSVYAAENSRESNIPCPRAGMQSGVGYEHCVECGQGGHAEVQALRSAGEDAKGGTLYLIGHTYCCQACQNELVKAGIVRVVYVN